MRLQVVEKATLFSYAIVTTEVHIRIIYLKYNDAQNVINIKYQSIVFIDYKDN